MVKVRLATVLLIALALASPGCVSRRQTTPALEKSFFLMDTVVTVQIYANPALATRVFDQVFAEASKLETVLSAHRPESDLARLAANAGAKPVAVSAATLALLQTGLHYAELSGGSLDITLGPVLNLYDFASQKRPTADQLEQTLRLVGWQNVIVDAENSQAFLSKSGMALDLGSLAKGYIVDRCLELLRENGIQHGLINAGGDIGFLSAKPDGSPWRVGLKNPDNPGLNFAVIEVSHGAIATSGDYERYFYEDGQRYHHIIDPATGLAAAECRSVTIHAETVELADLLATAVFVLGPERGLALVEALPNTEAVIWDAAGRVIWSSGLEDAAAGESSQRYFRCKRVKGGGS